MVICEVERNAFFRKAWPLQPQELEPILAKRLSARVRELAGIPDQAMDELVHSQGVITTQIKVKFPQDFPNVSVSAVAGTIVFPSSEQSTPGV